MIIVRVVGRYSGTLTVKTAASAQRAARKMARENPCHWVDARDLESDELVALIEPTYVPSTPLDPDTQPELEGWY